MDFSDDSVFLTTFTRHPCFSALTYPFKNCYLSFSLISSGPWAPTGAPTSATDLVAETAQSRPSRSDVGPAGRQPRCWQLPSSLSSSLQPHSLKQHSKPRGLFILLILLDQCVSTGRGLARRGP